MKTFWISFANERGNLGVVIVDSETKESALDGIKAAGIYPGGEAMFTEMPDKAADEVDRWGKNRLIPPSELARAGYTRLSQVSEEQRNAIESHPAVSFICEDCAT